MLRSQSLLRGPRFFYMTIDGEHEVAQNFYLKKKEESSYKHVHRLI